MIFFPWLSNIHLIYYSFIHCSSLRACYLCLLLHCCLLSGLLSISLLQNCRSTEKNAMATCFSLECASYNSNRPIRYCSQCNNIRHNNRRGTDHIVHTNISSPWTMEPQMQHFTIEAIVRCVLKVSGVFGGCQI